MLNFPNLKKSEKETEKEKEREAKRERDLEGMAIKGKSTIIKIRALRNITLSTNNSIIITLCNRRN